MSEQLIINIIYYFEHFFVQIFNMHFLYTLMLTAKSKAHRIIALVVFPLLNITVSIALDNLDSPVRSIVIYLLTFLPVFVCFKESKIFCFFSALIVNIILSVVDIIWSSVFMAEIGYFPTKLETKTWLSILFSAGCFFLFDMCAIPVCLLWRKKFKKKVHNKSLTYFFLFPLGQIFFLYACSYPTWSGSFQVFSNGFMVLAFVISIISDIAMFYALKESSKMEEMKLKVMEMEHSLEMQYQYYNSLTEKQKEIRQYRHDINNLVTTVEALVEKNISLSDGAAMMEEMKEKAKGMAVPVYCANPIVNTVLWQKQKEAEEAGIEFSISMDKEEDFPIDRISACSLFANLIDNAIREAKTHETPFVKVKASRKICLIFLEVSNSGGENIMAEEGKPKTTKKGGNHGHGLDIVHKIVEKYDGEFILKAEGGKAIARVCVKISEKDAA